MKNQFGYKLIKVKGILCSAAFFLGMMMSVSANAAVTIDEGGIATHNNIAETADITALSTAQSSADVAQTASISTAQSSADVAQTASISTAQSTADVTQTAEISTAQSTADVTQTAEISTAQEVVDVAQDVIITSITTNDANGAVNVLEANIGADGLTVDGATTLSSSLTQSGGNASFTSGGSNLTVSSDVNEGVSASTANSELSLTDALVEVSQNGHGLYIETGTTTLTGGTTSSQIILNDGGAQFSSTDPTSTFDMGDHRVTGVADGVDPFDAVNKGQLDAINNRLQNQIDDNTSGIASVAAMANIPAPLPGHKYSMGVGYGNFQGEQAIAFGGSAMVTDSVNVKMSAGVSGSDVTIGAGAGISW